MQDFTGKMAIISPAMAAAMPGNPMPDDPSNFRQALQTLEPGSLYRIHRYCCQDCGNVGTVVKDERTELVLCPCGGVAIPSSGDD